MRLLPTLLLACLSALGQPSPHELIRAAHTEVLAGRLPEAERIARQALDAMGPGAPADSRVAAYQVLATVLANTGRTRETFDEFAKALALEPRGRRLGGLEHAMAMVSWTAGDLDTAARLLTASVVLLKGSEDVWEVMVDQASLEMTRGKKSRATELCRKALPMIEAMRGPNHPVLLNRIYTCAVIELEKEPERSEQRLARLLEPGALQTEVRRAIILAQMARARLRTKRLGDASAAIDDAVAMARTSGDAQLLAPFLEIRARILRAMKRKGEAAECEREAAALSVPRHRHLVDARILQAGTPHAPRTDKRSR